jgi:drug/metabolite transporter (DMT)-like permease
MPLFAIGLILFSALCHVSWHLSLKNSHQRIAFIWWALTIATLVYLPLGLRQMRPETLPYLVPIVIGSGLAETAYFIALSQAYEAGDFSLVYPVARGTSPLLVALAAVIFLGERLTPLGLLGITLIVVGVYLDYRPSLGGALNLWGALRAPAVLWALAASLCTATYSILDKVGVGILTPRAYNLLIFVAMVLFLTPYAWGSIERSVLLSEIRKRPLPIIVSGGLIFLAYSLVLWAMTLSPVSYVSAAREISIVIGAAVGSRLFREPFGRWRVAAAALMFGGITCLAMAR